MALNKIFIHKKDLSYSEVKESDSDITFIRKDALLDKLNLALKLRGDDNPNSNDDGIQTIKAMINYIESL